MRAWLSSVLATKPLEAGHKPRIWLVRNADRRPVAVSTHQIVRNAGYTGLAAQPATSVRADGLPSGDLQQLAQALFRAHIAVSSPRHELAETLPAGSCCTCQDGDWISVAAAADCLSVSRRQVQRLAEHDAERCGARRIGSIWALKRSAVLALAAERRKAAK